jgi:hypothetical protein
MADELQGAIDRLKEKLAREVQAVSATKRAINVLAEEMGQDPIYPDAEPENLEGVGSLRPDEYYGKTLGKSAQDFIRRSKTACTLEQIVAGLVRGGFDFKLQGWTGGESDRARALAAALSKNPDVFHRLPSGLWGLAENYPTATKRMDAERAAKKRATKKNAKKRITRGKTTSAPHGTFASDQPPDEDEGEEGAA